MSAAGKVHADTLGQRGAAGLDGGAGGTARALHHLRGPGKADPAQLLRGHLAVHNPLQVVAVVCAQDFLVGRRVRLA